jgi:hypothetical protein
VIVRVATLFVLALVLGACDARTEDYEVTFRYTAFGGDDEMDQVLEIDNAGATAVVPTLQITPLDDAKRPIAGVKVTSAFGSERGGRVLPPFYTEIDVLKFEGERAGEVRDVRVKIERLEHVDFPEVDEPVTTERFDDGRSVESQGDTFDAVELANPNKDAVPVRVVLIGWRAEEDGNPQQADWVIPISDELVTVPGGRRTMVDLPPDLADNVIVSVKAFPAR